MAVVDEVREVLRDTLQLGSRADELEESSPLLGSLPEFDSMAVITIITSLEEQYEFMVSDDEIDAEAFETVGTLVDFVQYKLAQ
ncbi:MAG: phosphopantetheine-binding protein [Candidatus Polarisedimenticolaceae bacterium]|nr:phosphopantetheine-binding protein [Candidatus Polarisedimenticolaceae bacterium]